MANLSSESNDFKKNRIFVLIFLGVLILLGTIFGNQIGMPGQNLP
ncbi:hypothetical protein [Candidatus Lokiarchaeum ossiferum]